jgi:hypothetical protein
MSAVNVDFVLRFLQHIAIVFVGNASEDGGSRFL